MILLKVQKLIDYTKEKDVKRNVLSSNTILLNLLFVDKTANFNIN